MSETALTEADKRRIEEEEKYRARVKEELNQAPKQRPRGSSKDFLTVIIVFIVLGAIGSIIPFLIVKRTGKSTTPPVTRRDFKASVKFTGTQFVITNLENLDCQNVYMEIYADTVCIAGITAPTCSPKGGYVLTYIFRGDTLGAGKTHEVKATQFTEINGTPFNPYEKQPKGIWIGCKGSNALAGISYTEEFNYK